MIWIKFDNPINQPKNSEMPRYTSKSHFICSYSCLLFVAKSKTFLIGPTKIRLKGGSSVCVLIYAQVSQPCITMGKNITKLFVIEATDRKPIIYVSSEKIYLRRKALLNSGFPNFFTIPATRAKRQIHKE